MWIQKLVNFTPELVTKIQKKADKMHLSFVATVRIILMEYFDIKEGKNDK